MKYAILLAFVISFTLLGSVSIFNESFSGPGYPAGWTASGPNATTVWKVLTTTNAGGTPNELELYYSPSATGTYRFYSPLVSTQHMHDLTLSFRYALSDFSTTTAEPFGVQVSNDQSSWTTVWSNTASGNITANLVTLTIPWTNAMAGMLSVGFFFEGNNFNINYWVIDDISLSYTNSLGVGTWPAGDYYPEGNLYVPEGQSLHLQPGAHLYFQADKALEVTGNLVANGTPADSIIFTSASGSRDWNGIKFWYSALTDSSIIGYAAVSKSNNKGVDIAYHDKVRLHHCSIRYNYTTGNGAGVLVAGVVGTIEDCDINHNQSESPGTGVFASLANHIIRNNRIHHNFTLSGGERCVGLMAYICDVSGIHDNIICNNSGAMNNDYAVSLENCTGTFARNLVANNAGRGIYVHLGSVTILNCTISGNTHFGLWNNATLTVRNTIMDMNGDLGETDVFNEAAASALTITYSCLCYGAVMVSGYGISPANFTHNQIVHPQFVTPPNWGVDWNALNSDWRPYYASCSVDNADPASPTDPDLSRADIGMHWRLLKPLLYSVDDVPYDQGRQVALRWNRSDEDVSFQFQSFYSIWREGGSRSANLVYVSDPSQISFGQASANRDICWRDGLRTWFYLGQIPAMNFADYGWNAPTLQDSSSTGTHPAAFMVAFHSTRGIWQAVSNSGYSVDNIPPYAPARLEIAKTGTDRFNLAWDAVTEGGWQGNSYPETNLITYKIYAGDTPDFVPGPANFLTSTPNPTAVLTGQTAIHKFYQVIASDSE